MRSDFAGMTVNERLFAAGLRTAFEAAARAGIVDAPAAHFMAQAFAGDVPRAAAAYHAAFSIDA